MKKTFVLFLCFALFLSACASQQTPQPTPAAQPVVITDALDREVSLEQAPQRIVVTGKASIMVLDALYMFPEAKVRVVAFEDVTQGDTNFISLLDPEYAQKAFLVRDAGVEQFVSAEPDLVLMKSSQAEKMGAPIEALDIPVAYVDFETPEQYDRDLKVLGQLFQNEARAKELIDYYNGKVEGISTALAGVDEKPRTLMLYYTDADGAVAFNVPPLSWMQTRMVEMAGGEVVWQDANPGSGWTKVTIEQVAVWDPDTILIVSYNKDPREVVSDLKADPQWQSLRAVQSGSLLAFPKDLYSWDQPDSRWVLGVQWLAARLHPEQFPNTDMVAVAQEFYQFAYGLDSTTFDASIKPTLQGDIP
ncbi:MAG: ABC transporter substrate-binding protein [Anaerolineaceae bacterium]